ncbi:MAG: hypothetical protein LBS62_11470 [Clostridiales bacterium]|jgi:uncharacterized protein (DUF697 family)|nr:hypothetical protein [Clostridiales bacterium]
MSIFSVTSKYAANKWAEKAHDVETVIEQHALAGGAAGLGASWLPGAGAAIAGAAMVPIVWSMYYRINTVCGIKLSKAVLRSIAGAIVSNIIASASSYLLSIVGGTLLSFIPVVGNLSAMALVAAANYGIVQVAGNVYAAIIQKRVDSGDDGSGTSEGEMLKAAATIISKTNIAEELQKAKNRYSAGRENGTISGSEKIDPID